MGTHIRGCHSWPLFGRLDEIFVTCAKAVRLAGDNHCHAQQEPICGQIASFTLAPALGAHVPLIPDQRFVCAVFQRLPEVPKPTAALLLGWWDEAYGANIGWTIAAGHGRNEAEQDDWDAQRLYAALESEIVPEFYDRDAGGVPHEWLARIRRSMERRRGNSGFAETGKVCASARRTSLKKEMHGFTGLRVSRRDRC